MFNPTYVQISFLARVFWGIFGLIAGTATITYFVLRREQLSAIARTQQIILIFNYILTWFWVFQLRAMFTMGGITITHWILFLLPWTASLLCLPSVGSLLTQASKEM